MKIITLVVALLLVQACNDEKKNKPEVEIVKNSKPVSMPFAPVCTTNTNFITITTFTKEFYSKDSVIIKFNFENPMAKMTIIPMILKLNMPLYPIIYPNVETMNIEDTITADFDTLAPCESVVKYLNLSKYAKFVKGSYSIKFIYRQFPEKKLDEKQKGIYLSPITITVM